jgi:antitoxin component of MazEF toxin-antitoxin module
MKRNMRVLERTGIRRNIIRAGISSKAVIIPHDLCSLLGIEVGDTMDITLNNGKLVFEKRAAGEAATSLAASPSAQVATGEVKPDE